MSTYQTCNKKYEIKKLLTLLQERKNENFQSTDKISIIDYLFAQFFLPVLGT